jgi:hypothetical protein
MVNPQRNSPMTNPGIGVGLRKRQTVKEDLGRGLVKKTKQVMNVRTGAIKTKEVIKNPSRPFSGRQTTTTVTKKGYCDENDCYKGATTSTTKGKMPLPDKSKKNTVKYKIKKAIKNTCSPIGSGLKKHKGKINDCAKF